MSGRLNRGVLLLAVGLIVLSPLSAEQVSAHHYEDSPIQPGAEIDYPGICSFNFVYEDTSENRYIGTAGHCVDHEGQYVIPAGFDQAIGQVTWRAYDDGLDFALIDIEEDLYHLVDPSVRHWGGPTGVATQADTAPGDRILHYGNGVYYRESELTSPRAGILLDHSDETYCAIAGVYGGDSGSSILTGDGLALGVNARLGLGCEPPTSLAGPTIPSILEEAKAQTGLELEVVTAPLEDAVDREQDRVEHLP